MMLGGMFAGHDEGDGEIIEKDGEQRRTHLFLSLLFVIVQT